MRIHHLILIGLTLIVFLIINCGGGQTSNISDNLINDSESNVEDITTPDDESFSINMPIAVEEMGDQAYRLFLVFTVAFMQKMGTQVGILKS